MAVKIILNKEDNYSFECFFKHYFINIFKNFVTIAKFYATMVRSFAIRTLCAIDIPILVFEAELQQSFSMCVFSMRLRFQSNYTGLSQTK